MKRSLSAISVLFVWLSLLLASCGGQPRYANHLLDETSPYLQQHAHNPVDWYPWGAEALAKAEAENKMLVISIGYSACHWCHVMEKETFADTSVARVMNDHFVSIKVDREERPDIDDVYMTACQLASEGGCGWPLNVFALPDGRPVYVGTYSPRRQWMQILDYFIELQQEQPEQLEEYAESLAQGVRAYGTFRQPSTDLTFQAERIDTLVGQIREQMDTTWGGRLGAPKFPLPVVHEFLLHYARRYQSREAWEVVETSLREMASGGIYDQLGGGFARYATDERWHVPHFEKMLYDNAQLVRLYSHAYQYSDDTLYRRIVRQTLEFVEQHLTSEEGSFWSSLDADSEGEEGAFYRWTYAEIDSLLSGYPAREAVIELFGITKQGNWEAGKNILDPRLPLETFLAEHKELRPSELGEALEQLRQARSQRERPGLDDKVLTSWNALMISGLVAASRSLGEDAYLEKALAAGAFLRRERLEAGGSLRRTSEIQGFLDDYAFTAEAFLALYEATFEEEWLFAAEEVVDYALRYFYDEQSGLFYYTSSEDVSLVARRQEVLDNVIPASNSVMADNLIRLGMLLNRLEWKERAEKQLRAVASDWEKYQAPDYFSRWGQVYLRQLFPPFEVVIIGLGAEQTAQAMQRFYLPDVLFSGGVQPGSLSLHAGKEQKGQTMIYVCRRRVCKLPVSRPKDALQQINNWK